MAWPHSTVMADCVGNVGAVAGLTWMTLEVDITLPQTVAVHVSVTSPPQGPGMVPRVEVTDPVSRQFPVKPLSYVRSLVVACPQSTVIAD